MEGSLESNEPCGYRVGIIGTIEHLHDNGVSPSFPSKNPHKPFNILQSTLILKEPTPGGDSLLNHVYRDQQDKLRSLAHEIKEIRDQQKVFILTQHLTNRITNI
jgi:hypothetical protein